MHKIKIFAFGFLLFAGGYAHGQSPFCFSFANQTTVSPTEFRVTLRVYSSDGNLKVGSSNFVFSYNTAGLSNPVYVSSPLSAAAGYDFSTPSLVITTPVAGQVSFNAVFDGNDNTGVTVPTTGLDLVVIGFTILNAAQTPNLTLLYNSGTSTTQTVAFDDNNATQVARSSADDCSPRLTAKAYFDGAYDTGSGLLNDGWRFHNKLPLTQPFNTITFGGTNATTAYTGTETTTAGVLAVTGANAITDWVYLELRNATDRSIVVTRRAALLQRDGDVVDMDGVTPVKFTGLAEGNYQVAIRHRLCLATRTLNAIAFNSGGVTPLNFTDNSNALTGSLKSVVVGANTFYMMYTGDCSRDGFILSTDLNLIRPILNTLPSGIDYFIKNLDLNFDAFILTSDLTALRQNLNKIQVNLNQ